ncbi:MAG: sugar phosphate isomerase/epimerase [Candidatus Acetothermia bacterium]|nr:sugar phosphate isomerase/epimerase [Candidatus Acetothermia bacterium]
MIRVIGEGKFGRWPLGLIVPVQDPTPFSPFAPGEWTDALARVGEHGCEAVELAVTDPTRLDAAHVAEALERAGLRLASLTTGQAAGKESLSLAAPDDAVRRRAVERIQAHMRLAAPFQAVVIVGLLRGVDGDPGLLVESLRECARADRTVRLALEPLNRYESRLVNTVAEGLSVMERVGAENVGLLVDTFHANIEEPKIGEAFRRAGDRLFHVHLADSNRWPPGHGHLEWGEVRDALVRIGYRGSLILECLPRPTAGAPFQAMGWLRSMWEGSR